VANAFDGTPCACRKWEQCLRQLKRIANASLRIALEARVNDRLQFRWNIGPVVTNGNGVPLEDRREQFTQRLAPERGAPESIS